MPAPRTARGTQITNQYDTSMIVYVSKSCTSDKDQAKERAIARARYEWGDDVDQVYDTICENPGAGHGPHYHVAVIKTN